MADNEKKASILGALAGHIPMLARVERNSGYTVREVDVYTTEK